MDKAKKETIYWMIGLLAFLAWTMFMMSLLPKNPVPQDWYMSSAEILLGYVLVLALVSCLIFMGIIGGRFIEARQYQKNGRYLGKDVS